MPRAHRARCARTRRQVARPLQHRPDHGGDVGGPVRAHRGQGRRRYGAGSRIGDDPDGRHRKPVRGRHPAHDMGFHVDRNGARLEVERGLGPGMGHRARNAEEHAANRAGNGLQQPLRPVIIGVYPIYPVRRLEQDRRSDDAGPRPQRRRQPARHPEAHHPGGAFRDGPRQRSRQILAVATADDPDPRPRRDSSFKCQAHDGDQSVTVPHRSRPIPYNFGLSPDLDEAFPVPRPVDELEDFPRYGSRRIFRKSAIRFSAQRSHVRSRRWRNWMSAVAT